MHMTTRFFTALLLSVLMTLAAHATVHQVNIQGFAFSPLELTIQQGDTVRWTNLDSYPHTATANGGEFDSGMLNLDDSFEYVFTSAGTYDYYCYFHTNMTAVIMVEGTPQHSANYHVVNIQDFAFNPQNLTIMLGDTVHWVNMDAAPHTATDGNGEFDSGTLNNGDSYDHIFMTPGTYNYICSIHPSMNGAITVAGGTHSENYHIVNIQNFAFDPQELTIALGDTVHWVNMDTAPHTATDGNGEFDSGTLNNGDSYDHVFMTPGTFSYVCSIHPNMNGAVTVAGGGGHSDNYHVVNIQNFAFDPQDLMIAVGDTVHWENMDSAPHTVTAVHGAFDSGNLNMGDSFDFVFQTEAVYAYVCSYHSNMTGSITVGHPTGGNSDWEPLNSSNTQPLNDIRFWDADLGWAAGEAGVMRTTDGGANWTTYQTADDVEAVYFVSESAGWLCGNDGMIMHSSDGGITWQSQTSGVSEKLRDIWFADAMYGWAVGRDGILLATSDGGATWSSQSSPATDDLRGIYMLDTQRGWIVGSDGLILYTSNGGQLWETQLSVPGGEEDEFEAVFALNENYVWAVGGQGRVYATTDSGENWNAQMSGTAVALMDVYFTDMESGWIGGAGGFLSAAMMGGAMWHTQIPPEAASFNAIYFVHSGLGFMAGGNGEIYKYEEIQSADDDPAVVSTTSIELLPAYPNPFNPSTTLSIVNPRAQWVSLKIYDLLGREVATLQNAPLGAGQHSYTFSGAALSSGLYIAQAQTGNTSVSRKLTLVK